MQTLRLQINFINILLILIKFIFVVYINKNYFRVKIENKNVNNYTVYTILVFIFSCASLLKINIYVWKLHESEL